MEKSKKVLQINTVPNGSTGKIMRGIQNLLAEDSGEISSLLAYANGSFSPREGDYVIGRRHDRLINKTVSANLGRPDFCLGLGTAGLLHFIEEQQPDLVHLHNLHGWYLSVPALFDYLKEKKVPVVWTLHDCWAFTGRCPHFVSLGCEKWRSGCESCPYPGNAYPDARFDRTKKLWQQKKELFTGLDNLTLVTPSEWLAGLVKQSFLKDIPVRVIHNGIDCSVFRARESSFRAEKGLEGKKIVLGVAAAWGRRKGLDVFCTLAERLPEEYQIVLVGTGEEIDRQLPANILSIHSTENQEKLADIYASADVFFNPTREETYPTVNMEALACGCPVVGFRTGGSPEMLTEKTGIVVPVDDLEASIQAIRAVCEERILQRADCLEHGSSFEENDRYGEYISLYREIFDLRR